jgi:hypothetical protein
VEVAPVAALELLARTVERALAPLGLDLVERLLVLGALVRIGVLAQQLVQERRGGLDLAATRLALEARARGPGSGAPCRPLRAERAAASSRRSRRSG